MALPQRFSLCCLSFVPAFSVLHFKMKLIREREKEHCVLITWTLLSHNPSHSFICVCADYTVSIFVAMVRWTTWWTHAKQFVSWLPVFQWLPVEGKSGRKKKRHWRIGDSVANTISLFPHVRQLVKINDRGLFPFFTNCWKWCHLISGN